MAEEGERILNCVPSARQERDWTLEDAWEAELVPKLRRTPLLEGGGNAFAPVDLREPWWTVGDQGTTGACVGWACEATLRHHFVKHGRLSPAEADRQLSVRHLWLAAVHGAASRERPSASFIEAAGASLKSALDVARKHGTVLEASLPLEGPSYRGGRNAFYMRAAVRRIPAYVNLGRDNPAAWTHWLRHVGPVLARIEVDEAFREGSASGRLDAFRAHTTSGGHAVCLVGFVGGRFVVRNSWGTRWGHAGYAYASVPYAMSAITEAYGVAPLPHVSGERAQTRVELTQRSM